MKKPRKPAPKLPGTLIRSADYVWTPNDMRAAFGPEFAKELGEYLGKTMFERWKRGGK